MISAADSKLCGQCLTVQPIGEFRCRRPGHRARMNECRTCHNLTERHRRAKRQSAQRNRQLARFAAQLKRERSHARVELLCAEMIESFGGLENLAHAWKQQVDRACQQHPGSKRVLDFFLAMAQLLVYCQETRPDPALMTEDELEEEMIEETMRHLRPKWAAAALRRLGWTVEPPPTSDAMTSTASQ